MAPHPPLKTIHELSLHDVEALRLILRGSSVIDWHRLNFPDERRAVEFVKNHELDLDRDRAYLDHVKREAILYLRRNFAFAIPKPVERASMLELLMMAAGKGHRQLCACTILKTIHIINHMAGRELLFRLPISDRDLFHFVEEKVYRVVGTMLSEGFPITEFVGGRKNLDSTYTKLLSKPESTAAALYDKLRFRIVTRSREHLLPVLAYLTEQLFPFNYVVPKQSTNTIFHFRSFCESHPHLRALVDQLQGEFDDALTPGDNRFSAPSYRVIHFVTDVPLRVPPHLMDQAPSGSESLGPIVYMLCEFQLLDAESEAANEASDASHEAYKERQRAAVARRLRVGARGRESRRKP
ncbi:MAG: TIGR04552 family protein [Polyangiaceae bacterium]|nr:TIGR04552 family protein [Polyangiaceae bacterium]